MNFNYANKTLKYFEKNVYIKGVEDKESDGKYLYLCTATIAEKEDRIVVPIAKYGGTGKELRAIATPYLNDTLSKVYKYWQECSNSNTDIPLFVVGHSFDEVFERKIKLLAPCIPDIRMLQYINVHRFFSFKTSIKERENKLKKDYESLKSKGKIEDEKTDFMAAMYNYLSHGGELGGKKYDILDWEVQAGEGTERAEKIDFLAVERSKKWLTVIELKFTDLKDIRLHGSIFQGMDYCNWVERHKYELAMIYNKFKIYTRHRTRLILLNGPEGFPDYYPKIVSNYKKIDEYQEIEFYSLENVLLPIKLISPYSSKNPFVTNPPKIYDYK